MGNYISCTYAYAPPLMKKNAKATRVIFPNGEVKQFKEILKAAELMLENPNYFLVNSRSLHTNRRFSALGADEELEFGNVYILFPMRRLNSIITAADLAVLFVASNSAAKRISGSTNKVYVLTDKGSGTNGESQEDGEGMKTSVEDKEVVPRLSLEGVDLGYQHRFSRSRKPVLETINEEPISSR